MDVIINLFILFFAIYGIRKWILKKGGMAIDFDKPIGEKNEKKYIEDNELIYDHKLCAYCHSYSLTKLEEKVGDAFWRYANLNGSQDMRKKNINYQLASVLADHRCNDCGAITLFSYYASDKPSTDGPIYSRLLLKDSPDMNKKKIGYNWPSTDG
jgi:hypothetical protein